jgi:hypothetical protein
MGKRSMLDCPTEHSLGMKSHLNTCADDDLRICLISNYAYYRYTTIERKLYPNIVFNDKLVLIGLTNCKDHSVATDELFPSLLYPYYPLLRNVAAGPLLLFYSQFLSSSQDTFEITIIVLFEFLFTITPSAHLATTALQTLPL